MGLPGAAAGAQGAAAGAATAAGRTGRRTEAATAGGAEAAAATDATDGCAQRAAAGAGPEAAGRGRDVAALLLPAAELQPRGPSPWLRLLLLSAASRSAASCSVWRGGEGEPPRAAAAPSPAGERMPLGVDWSEAGVDASGVLPLLPSSLNGLRKESVATQALQHNKRHAPKV